MRYAIQLAYNGTNYYGWQSQEHGNTVQQVLELYLGKLFGEKIAIMGCGRTDTGVHATSYIAHFDAVNPVREGFLFKLNSCLPSDIAVYDIWPVSEKFHSRFRAISRKYEYHISRRKDPFLESWSYLRYGPLDIEKMNQAGEFLLTQTDFKTFSKVKTAVKTFDCKLQECYWEEKNENEWVFHVKADRFLRNMVRSMVGTLLEIGAGKRDLDDLKSAMQSRDRSNAGKSVPAKGLFLTEITYNWAEFVIHE